MNGILQNLDVLKDSLHVSQNTHCQNQSHKFSPIETFPEFKHPSKRVLSVIWPFFIQTTSKYEETYPEQDSLPLILLGSTDQPHPPYQGIIHRIESKVYGLGRVKNKSSWAGGGGATVQSIGRRGGSTVPGPPPPNRMTETLPSPVPLYLVVDKICKHKMHHIFGEST